MKSVSGCVCVHGQVMDLDLGDPGEIERVDDLLRLEWMVLWKKKF